MKPKIRHLVTAMIFNQDSILLLKRSEMKSIHPGIWTGVGGHIESNELSTPKLACLREISEETGLKESDFNNLDLQYIVFSKNKAEIRQQFVFIGNSLKREVVQSNEGELHWIHEHEIFNRVLPDSHNFILQHFLENRNKDLRILIGTVNHLDKRPEIVWNQL